jgi:hypothetical protein
MDVLEHVDDDLGLLRSYADRMRGRGHVLITVPAFQALWSGHDEFLEHRRRYTLRQVEDLVRSAGLRVVRGNYFFGSLLPLVAARRWVDRRRLASGRMGAKSELRLHSARVNTVLTAIHDAERRLFFRFNRLAGLSVFCLATRT